MALEPASPKVQQLIRDKMQHVLDVCSSGGFGYRQAALLRLKEIEVTGVDLVGPDDTAPTRGATAKVTVELEVDEECCNMAANAHGGFLAWAIDLCSSLPLLALAGHDRWTTSGVSSNINVFYIAAAPLGMPIRIVSTVLQQGKTSATIEARVEERATGKLLAIGTHVKQDVSGRPKL